MTQVSLDKLSKKNQRFYGRGILDNNLSVSQPTNSSKTEKQTKKSKPC